MKKDVKMLCRVMTAALSAAALMAIGGMSAYAAGWTQNGGQWYYYNSDGNAQTDTWKKSGDHYFYLGPDGAMMRNALIKDDDGNYSYVNEDGAKVVDQWVHIQEENTGVSGEAEGWYYFGSNGNAYRRTESTEGIYKKTVNGKYYAFDDNGKMLYGWVDEDGNQVDPDTEDPFTEGTYYFGDADDGVMRRTQWMEYTEGSDDQSNVDGIDYSDYDSLWFYFDSSGKKYAAGSSQMVEKSINGYKYSFDQNGVMLSSWVDTTASTSSANNAKYYSDSDAGQMKKNTWVYAVPAEYMNANGENDNENGTERWFYVGTNGKVYANTIKKINSKKYMFNEDGVMETGFVLTDSADDFSESIDPEDLTKDDFSSDAGIIAQALNGGKNLYYFGADEQKDGAMRTGKAVKVELSDDTYTFGFDKQGKAYGAAGDGPELVSNKYYLNGLLLNADADNRYGIVTDKDGNEYVVGTSGAVVKGGHKAAKDGNDSYVLIVGDMFYGYVEEDHAPLWKDGAYYRYDEDADGHIGELIELGTDDGMQPEMRLN